MGKMNEEERSTHVPFFAIHALAAFFQSLSHRQALKLGSGMGDLLRILLTSKSRLTRTNLEQAFPELAGTEEIRNLEREVFRHFGKVGAEFLRFPVLSDEWMREHVSVDGLHHMNDLLKQGRGVLAFSAHFGNWELALKRIALETPTPIHVVIRRIKDTNVHSFIKTYRERYGKAVSILQDHGAVSILKILRKNGIIVGVLDQNSSVTEGVFSPFFGRPASTYSSLSRIAIKYGIPLLPVFDARVSAENHHVRLGPPLAIPDLPESDAIQHLTDQATARIEEAVRQYPEQWIWMHNRWKTVAPKDRSSFPSTVLNSLAKND
ncbi:MAG: lysophospholipid acyltransferase family protein [Leptospirales bacterium]